MMPSVDKDGRYNQTNTFTWFAPQILLANLFYGSIDNKLFFSFILNWTKNN
jgi:hypothetical protein